MPDKQPIDNPVEAVSRTALIIAHLCMRFRDRHYMKNPGRSRGLLIVVADSLPVDLFHQHHFASAAIGSGCETIEIKTAGQRIPHVVTSIED